MWNTCFIISSTSGRLVKHIAKEGVTACGITWDSLPDIVGSDGEVWTDDKAWYDNHDVDYDVPKCEICPTD